jgi:hypothetical protein
MATPLRSNISQSELVENRTATHKAGDIERDRRNEMLRQIRSRGPGPYQPAELRDRGIYNGAAGIWVDKQNTVIAPEALQGVTVSIPHTGEHYPDDLSESGLIYHYPTTKRPSTRDQNEIDATKAAKLLQLPIFVLPPSSGDEELRDLKIGWVDDWDDNAKEFLVIFSDVAPEATEPPAQSGTFLYARRSATGEAPRHCHATAQPRALPLSGAEAVRN